MARVCQEAGARVARNVRLADMNIDVPVSDDCRVEVAANGLSFWHGAQQAVDATIVSPVTRAGEAQPGANVAPDARRAPCLGRTGGHAGGSACGKGSPLVGAARRRRTACRRSVFA